MTMGMVNMRHAGEGQEPSPSIWGDCPLDRLIAGVGGRAFHNDFLGGSVSAIDGLSLVGDTATVTYDTGHISGVLKVATGSADNDEHYLMTEPFGKIVKNSGNKMWLEARVALGQISDQGSVLALAEEDALAADLIADDAGGMVGQSYVGFRQLTDNDGKFDAAFKLDAGTENEVQADVTNDAALDSDNQSDMTADTFRKLGLRFDGKNNIDFYVDGVKVASYEIDTSEFPDGVNFGAALGLKTGTAASRYFLVDWIRGAYQDIR